MIAIPDFGVGAMENWGLITYRETSILYDPNETSATAHQWVAVVIAHELSHQVGILVFAKLQDLVYLEIANFKLHQKVLTFTYMFFFNHCPEFISNIF